MAETPGTNGGIGSVAFRIVMAALGTVLTALATASFLWVQSIGNDFTSVRDDIRETKGDIRSVRTEVAALRVLMAGDYIRRDEVAEMIRDHLLREHSIEPPPKRP